MADLKISQMTDASALAGTELVPLVQSGSNVKADTSFLQDFILEGVNDLLQTWNDSGTTFTAIKMNVTDTASAAGSLLMDLRVGGSSRFSVDKSGIVTAKSGFRFSDDAGQIFIGRGAAGLKLNGSTIYTTNAFGVGSIDCTLFRDAAGTLAQRNGTNAQTFNLYNTYTDDTIYERGFARWNSNVFEIGTEAAGTGTARDVRIASGNNISLTAATTTDFVDVNFATGTSTGYRLTVGSFYVYGSSYTNADLGNSTYKWRDVYVGRSVIFYEQSADPSDPGEGASKIWQSNGTGSGNDGEIMVKTTAGGVTKQGNIVLSDTGTAGANTASINNIVTVTQAEYDLLTPDADTVYFITA